MRRRLLICGSLLLLLGIVTWARIALVDRLHDQGYFAKYVQLADRILAGRIPLDRIADVSPGYLWLTVAFRGIGMAVGAIRGTQIVVLSLAALLCAAAAARLSGWVGAVVAAVLVLGSRAALVTATELEPETMILLLNAAALLLVVRWWTAASPALLWPAGLLMGVSAVFRPTAIAAIGLLLLLMLWRRSWRAAAGFAAAAAIPIAVVMLVNGRLTGDAVILHAGTHVYDGNNPLATGCAGVMPRIVADLNAQSTEPDFLHVAYRMVAARATATPVDAGRTSRYWSGKTWAFFRTYPSAAARLFFWKGVLAVHHYDVYDLRTTKRKADELARYPAIPFGTGLVLGIAALVLRKRRSDLLPAVAFAAATLVALVAFNVSSRQRNPLLVPFAVAGGVGIAEIVALARARQERALIAIAATVVAIPLLGIEGPPMREDAYNWVASERSTELRGAAYAARARGDERSGTALAALASVADTADPPLVTARTLRSVALGVATRTEAPETLFDAAVALEKAGAWQEALQVASRIGDYAPRRENRAVSSLSYYRARAALHLGAPPPAVQRMLSDAERESPGDPDVLALRYVLGDATALARLEAMHDPFTRDDAMAHALRDTGRIEPARALLQSLTVRFPEWRRPDLERRRDAGAPP
jgi:hypothetical protein